MSVQKRRYLIVSHQTCDHESGPKVGHILVRGLSNKHEFQNVSGISTGKYCTVLERPCRQEWTLMMHKYKNKLIEYKLQRNVTCYQPSRKH